MRARLIPLALLALSGSAGAAYMSSCNQLQKFGLGELGTLPAWAQPDCSDAALRAERLSVANTAHVLFIQSYRAALARFGGARVAQDIQDRMKKAGYRALASKRDGSVIRTTFVNAAAGKAYTVIMWTDHDPSAMQLVKTSLK